MTKAVIKSERYALCPACEERLGIVEHLFAESFGTRHAGPWYCDNCGAGWKIEVDREAGTIELTEHEDKARPTIVELRIPPQSEPITLFVSGLRWESENGTDKYDHDQHNRYYYEQHTCPENYFHSILEIYLGDKADPHGLAKYVATRVVIPPDADVHEIVEELRPTL